MRNSLLHSALFLLVLGTSLTAQSSPDETARLRELLALAPGKHIAIASSPRLPAGSGPLRVFLATGIDKQIRGYYARQIKQWNRFKDANLATLELVHDLNRADIILARYKLNEKAQTSKSSIAVYEQTYDPATRTTTPRPVIKADYYQTVRVNGYILRRVGPDVEILRNGVFQETKKEGAPIVDGLWTAFTELLSAP